MAAQSAAETAFREANSLFVDECFAEALDLYTRAVELDTSNAVYLVHRAACLLKLKKYVEALDDAVRALRIDPNNSKAYMRKGLALFQLEEYYSAKVAFEAGQKLESAQSESANTWKLWIRKCNAELDAEQEEEEQKRTGDKTSHAVASAATTAPTPTSVSSPTVQSTITTPPASAHTDSANRSALEMPPLEDIPPPALTPNQQLALDYKSRGNDAFSKKDYRQALSHYSQAIQLDPSNSVHFSNRSAAYLRIGDALSALEDADACVRVNPKWSKAHFRRGEALVVLRRFTEAISAYERALSLEPSGSKEAATIQSFLDGVRAVVQIESDCAAIMMSPIVTTPAEAREIQRVIRHNTDQLASKEFATAAAAVTMRAGTALRLMQNVVVDNDSGRIVALKPPPLSSTAALIAAASSGGVVDNDSIKKLREGKHVLVHVFIHIDNEPTENDTVRRRLQRVDFRGWEGKTFKERELEEQKVKSGEVPATLDLSGTGGGMASEKLSEKATAILQLTKREIEARREGVVNPLLEAMLFNK